MRESVKELLKQVGPGKMSGVAYDTAWVARLGEIDSNLSARALEWLAENQLADGSWGAERPVYYHDRVVSTLAAMIALTYRGQRSHDRARIERGLTALGKMTSGMTGKLQQDSNGPTVGFEMIVPTLVSEAQSLGLLNSHGDQILEVLDQQRKTKLGLLQGKMINRDITAAFSAEMAGVDGQHMLDVENLQESNGSVGHSPSATAYFALNVRPGNEQALEYLHNVTDVGGGIPDLMPFDIYEALWVLWNFSLVDGWDQETIALFQPLLNSLRQGWKSDRGIGFSVGYSVPDADNTSFTYEVLSRFGDPPDIETVLAFEEDGNFRTYRYESHSSPSVNIHALGALRQAGFDNTSSTIQKILVYLKKTRIQNAFWFDKWNLSPYYTTAHAIIACAGFANELIRSSVEWMLQTQNSDGSWGFQFPTAEETAYCIQALEVWRRRGGDVPRMIVQKAYKWLKENGQPPYPPLWIGKGLYVPDLVVRSAILSAFLIVEEG